MGKSGAKSSVSQETQKTTQLVHSHPSCKLPSTTMMVTKTLLAFFGAAAILSVEGKNSVVHFVHFNFNPSAIFAPGNPLCEDHYDIAQNAFHGTGNQPYNYCPEWASKGKCEKDCSDVPFKFTTGVEAVGYAGLNVIQLCKGWMELNCAKSCGTCLKAASWAAWNNVKGSILG